MYPYLHGPCFSYILDVFLIPANISLTQAGALSWHSSIPVYLAPYRYQLRCFRTDNCFHHSWVSSSRHCPLYSSLSFMSSLCLPCESAYCVLRMSSFLLIFYYCGAWCVYARTLIYTNMNNQYFQYAIFAAGCQLLP